MPHVYDDQLDGPSYLWPTEPRPRPVIAQPRAGLRPSARKLTMIGVALLALVLVKAAAYRPEPVHRVNSDLFQFGQQGVITRGGPRFPQLDDVSLLLDDAVRGNHEALRRDPPAGATVRLAPGTPVRLLHAGPRGSRVQVAQGVYRGRIGWVAQGYAWPEGLPPSTTGPRVARRID